MRDCGLIVLCYCDRNNRIGRRKWRRWVKEKMEWEESKGRIRTGEGRSVGGGE